jgi:sugar lactone lactonase YvrE
MRPTAAQLVLALLVLGALALGALALGALAPPRAAGSEFEDKSYVATLNGPCGIAIDANDRKIIADTGNDRVIVLDENFKPVGVIEALRKRVNHLKQPHGVACDAAGRIIVADTGNHCVKVFDQEGHYQFTIGRDGIAGSRAGLLRSPEGVSVDARGNIIVFDTGNKRVQIFDDRGDYIMQFRHGEYSARRLVGPPDDPEVVTDSGEVTLERPVRGCLLDDGHVVVADTATGHYSVWRYSTARQTAGPVKLVEPRERTAGWIGDVAYDRTRNELVFVEALSPTSDRGVVRFARVRTDELQAYPEAVRMLKAEPADWPPSYETTDARNGRLVEPRSVAIDSHGNAVVVDGRLNVAVQIARAHTEPASDKPPPMYQATEIGPTYAVIEYDTIGKVPTLLEYGPVNASAHGAPRTSTTRLERNTPRRHHRVPLGGLEPATRYVYQYLTTQNAYPREHLCEPRVVTTSPGRGTTAILDIEALIVLFTNVVTMPEPDALATDEDGNAIMPEKPGPMTPEQIARIKADLQRACDFYWLNSHMTLNVSLDVIEIDDEYEGVPSTDRAQLEELLAAHGRRMRGARGGVVLVYGVRHWDTQQARWTLSSGDGRTWLSPDNGVLISAFNAGGDVAWSFASRYARQLGIVTASDDELVADSGAGWHGLARMARNRSPQRYLGNLSGTVRVVRDGDDDGFPDDDPACPFDEKRFGTRPDDDDSDADGVDDLAEVMFSEWLTPGGGNLDFVTFGARTAQPRVRPQPYNADTDGDNFPDADDAFPLDRFGPAVDEADITVDGEAGDGEWASQATRLVDDPAFNGRVCVNWCSEGLCFLIEQQITPEQAQAYNNSASPMRVQLRIDGNNDGWTLGSDNAEIVIDAQPGGATAVRTIHHDYTGGAGAVSSENTVIAPDEVAAAWTASDERFVLELMIPKNVGAGINCIAGEQLGFAIMFQPDGAEHGLRLFEPQVLFDVTLRERR